MLDQIASESSLLRKEKLIEEGAKSAFFRKTVLFALNPFLRFNCTKLTPVEYKSSRSPVRIFEVLQALSEQRGATDDDIVHLAMVSSIDEDTIDVVVKILNKDLRCGAAIKLFQKYIDIPSHELCLCGTEGSYLVEKQQWDPDSTIEKYFKKVKPSNQCWSRKLDGVRCWAVVNGTNVQYLSRSGKAFPNFHVFDDELVSLASFYDTTGGRIVIFDGEVEHEDKDFQTQMTEVRRLNEADPSKFVFTVFDIPSSDENFTSRYSDIVEMFEGHIGKVSYLEHHNLESSEAVSKLLTKVRSEGYEGLVLKDWSQFYEFKRTPNWCKVKEFHTDDLEVLGWEYGTGKNAKVMGKLICLYKGVKVKVGSGFNDEQRIAYMKTTPSIIEVRFQEVTKDGSLRFPTFIRVRDDK